MRNVSTKKAVSMLLAILLLMSLTACGNNAGNPASSDVPAPVETSTPINAGKDTPCTESEIAEAINVGNLLFNEKWCEYLVTHQDYLPGDVLACLNEHIGEYKMVKLGEDSETELTDENIGTIAAVLQLHGYTPEILVSMNSTAISPDALAARVADNEQYMIDATTAYPKPEDGMDFLPCFKNFEPVVQDEALGVTLTAPREVTDTTTFNRDIDFGTAISRCALFTNNSDKRVQLIAANDLPDSEWQKMEGYDPSLVMDWSGSYDPTAGESSAYTDVNLIPLGAASVLEPGESTVVRFAYLGREDEDFDFIARFSYYVTDGESTELLKGFTLNHIRPSQFPATTCTVTGTVYDEETGLPIPFIDVQTSRGGAFGTTDIEGRFTFETPAFQFDSTGNWGRSTIFVNELGVTNSSDSTVNPAYAEESIIVEPHTGETMELTLVLKKKPAQVNYTLQTQHDMGMQAYCVDISNDIIATAPFHTTFSTEYKYENGYLHVFDKYGNLLFEKWLRGESAFCDISTDGTLVASVVHGEKVGDPDTAVVWDIEGNEVFSYQVPYKENPALYVQPEEGHGEGVFSKLGDLEISNDGKLLLMATDEGYVSVVRLSDKKILCDFFGNAKMYKLFWSADDKVVYTGTEAGDFLATEVATGKMLWKKYIEGTIFGWAMNDTCVVTSTKSTGVGYLICTELATGKTLWTLDVGMRCSSMTLSHDGKTLFWGTDTGGTNSGQMFIDMETGTPLWSTVSGKQAAAFSADDRYVAIRSGGNLTLWTITGEHLYGALIALDDNSMSWGLYMSGDCKNIVSFAGGSMDSRFYGVMYALTLDEDTPLE
ncbi:MAG: PQQ-binding-like beta-propeller repeat protein [Eubacteriales bacterium]|nr:PQQ-binding-like beta-propeller repeat protein [Eubacteriales bacterium]